MSGPVLGIDLGTTNSVVAVVDGPEPRVLADAEGYNLIPSVVSFHPNGEILVGRSARDRRLLDARNTVYSVKRLIGRPFRSPEVGQAQQRFPFDLAEGPTGGVLVSARNDTYTLSEISAFVLRQVRTVAEQSLGMSLTRAVVTVPANFNELQRSATKAAGRVAGLDVLRILNEPTAAALAYGYGKGSKERVAIFDLGGGTFDLTLLELSGDVFEVLATAGDTYLGGDDVDVLIADQMASAFLEHHRYDAKEDKQAYERLRAAAEWAKCQLSDEEEVQLRVEELAYGDGGQSLDLTFGLSRLMLEQMAQPLIARAFDVCEDAMRVAGIRPTQLDNVILVGGSTRMPLVQRMVAEYFSRQPLQNIDPDLVVAKGAAIQGTALTAPAERRALGRVRLKKLTQKELQAVEATRQRRAAPAAPASALRGAVEVGAPQHIALDGRTAPLGDDGDTQVRGSPLSAQLEAETRAGRPGAQTWDGPVPAAVAERAAADAAADAPTATANAPTAAGPADFDFDIPTDPGVPPVHEERDIDLEMPTARFGGAPVEPAPDIPPAPPALPPAAPPPVPPPSPVAFEEVAPPPTAATAHAPPAGQIPVPGYVEEPPGIDEMIMPELPLLLDVTPHSLRIETVGGFSEVVIKRNAAIPVEQTRIFSTAKDSQDGIRVRICQGESRRLEENQGLGVIELLGLRPAPRGQVKIDVTFIISADGTLGVRARDAATGNEQIVHIKLVGAVDEDEIQRMQARQQQLMGQG